MPVDEERIFNSDQLDKFIYLMVKMDFTKACDYVNHKPKGIFNNLIIYICNLLLEVPLTIGREFQKHRSHLISSLFASPMLTDNNFEENIEFRQKLGCCRQKN